jgi:hypothetical protein
MTSADVRARLVHALRLDLIGPEPDEPQASEILSLARSRWYLTGFLVPWDAPASQKRDEDDALEMDQLAAATDSTALRHAPGELPARYRAWIDARQDRAPTGGPQGEVAASVIDSARRAAQRIEETASRSAPPGSGGPGYTYEIDGNNEVVRRALTFAWPDFEDAVCAAAAEASGCDAIVTRDPGGCPDAPLPVIDPAAALSWLVSA